MSTYKRRIVYLSDEEWSTLLAESKARKQTISSLIRDWLRDAWTATSPQRGSVGPVAPISTSQAHRDELLRKINRGR
jgi:hypothetical protein